MDESCSTLTSGVCELHSFLLNVTKLKQNHVQRWYESIFNHRRVSGKQKLGVVGCHNVSVCTMRSCCSTVCPSVCSPLMCQDALCKLCNGIITQSYCTCRGLIWQLDRAVVTYFCSVFIASYPMNFQQSDWRQQDSNGRAIWASEHLALSYLPADAACW